MGRRQLPEDRREEPRDGQGGWTPQPERTRLGDIWARALHEIYFKRMSAADALKKASGEVDKVLKEAGIK